MPDDLPPDELIADQGVKEVPDTLPFKRPRKFHHIDDSVIHDVGTYMELVIRLEGSNREVDVSALLRHTKTLFRRGRNDYDEKYWMQITASAVREVIIFLKPRHYLRALPHLPDEVDPNGREFYEYLGNLEDYLSKLVHYKPLNSRANSFRSLYGHDEDYSSLSDEDYFNSEGRLFEEVCIDMVHTLKDVLANHRD